MTAVGYLFTVGHNNSTFAFTLGGDDFIAASVNDEPWQFTTFALSPRTFSANTKIIWNAEV